MIVQSENYIQNPLVSVVIVTYNQEQYIRQCIDSILTQETDFPFEIIIGEDCGTDSTRDICIEYQQKYPNKIKLLLQDSNQGLIRNYRDVLNLCRGEYIAQCAGDDYWIDNLKIQKQVDFLEKNEDYGFSGTGAYELKKNSLVEIKYECRQSGNIFQRALENTPIVACTLVFRSILLNFINFEDFLFRNFTAEDYPMQVIFAKKTKFYYLSDKTSVYRIQSSSISNHKNIFSQFKYQQGLFEIRKYFKEIFPKEYDLDEVFWSNHLIYLQFRVAKSEFNYLEARKIVSDFIGKTKKIKKTKLITSNILFFYISCLVTLMWITIKKQI